MGGGNRRSGGGGRENNKRKEKQSAFGVIAVQVLRLIPGFFETQGCSLFASKQYTMNVRLERLDCERKAKGIKTR